MIYFLEDDNSINEAILYSLKNSGFEVKGFNRPSDFWKAMDITLTYKEYQLLLHLMQNKGIVFSREKLLNKIWGYDFDGENRTVDVHIRTLRTKLGECGAMIETVRGFGYKIGE